MSARRFAWRGILARPRSEARAREPLYSALDARAGLRSRCATGTTPARELQAGFTTFAAMAYILAVNPSILADAGMDRAALVTVTALSAATATALMALLTNYPLALAPGMGINSFFTYTICLGAGVPWQQALGHGVRQRLHLPAALAHRRARAHHRRDSLLAQARHHLRHRPLHRVRRAEKRRRHRGQPGHLGHARRLHVRPRGAVPGGPRASPPCWSRAACPGAIVLGIAITTLIGLVVPNGAGAHGHHVAGVDRLGPRLAGARASCSSI